jgi:hypothetical protein
MAWWAGVAALVALATFACGGDDDDDVAFTPGTVDCDTLINGSYRYNVSIHYIVDPSPTPLPSGAGPGHPAVDLRQELVGSVEDADSFAAEMTFIDRSVASTTGAMHDDGRGWLQSGGRWTEQVASAERPVGDLVPYLPKNFCQALAPDIDTTVSDRESEDVNGIRSQRFNYTDFVTDFPDRTPDFGGGSDVGVLINEFDGSVWVANNGNFISKIDMSGEGTYPDGAVMHFSIAYEISDLGADINLEPPI